MGNIQLLFDEIYKGFLKKAQILFFFLYGVEKRLFLS